MKHFDFIRCRVMVVGDMMLDKYISGVVERLSQEAQVPGLLRESESGRLGRRGECLGLMLDRGVAMLVNESCRDHRSLDVSNPHRT